MPQDDAQVEKRWTGGELLVCAVIQLLLVHVAYRIDRMKGAPYISSPSWAIIFGLGYGALLSFSWHTRARDAGLDPQILFFGLLPPIILEAGFNTQRKGFFSNFLAICLLAIVGTLIATFVTGGIMVWLEKMGLVTNIPPAEAFLFGSLISAIDPVATLLVLKKCHTPPLLFNLVFGESVLNDAIAIVLYGLFQKFSLQGRTDFSFESMVKMSVELLGVGFGSVVFAAAVCYASAFLLRYSDSALRQYPTYEISIVLLSAYGSYVGAEFLELSGLLAVFFSGVLIRHYHMYNISKASSTAFSHLISTLAFLSENFIYIYLGVSVIAYSDVLCWDWGWILASFGAQIVARACNTFPLCFLANCFRLKPIPFKYMVVIWFSGLRGAIAFALALNATSSKPEHAAIIRSATLFSVLFTTVVFSMLTGPLVRILGLAGVEPNRGMETEHSPLIPNARRRSIRDTWVGFDEKHLKPIFGGNPRTTDDSSPYMSIPRRERGLDLSELNDESEPNELSFVNRKSSTNPKSSSTTGEESYA